MRKAAILLNIVREKSLAVCTDCHYKIHSGEYDGSSLRKSAGEPRDKESCHAGFGEGWLKKYLKKQNRC